MFVALYRWRLIQGREAQFTDAWSAVTIFYRDNFGSFGSRLHLGNDGVYYAYAMWPTAEDREKAFAADISPVADHRNAMASAIAESFPETILDVVADHLDT